MTNNDILKKLRVALQLRNDQIQEIIGLTGLEISLTELGAFFRAEDHRNYRPCGDQVLRNFLDGLIISMRGSRGESDSSVEATSTSQREGAELEPGPAQIGSEKRGNLQPGGQKDAQTSAPPYSSKDTQRDTHQTAPRAPQRPGRPEPREQRPPRDSHPESRRQPPRDARSEPRSEAQPEPPREARRETPREPQHSSRSEARPAPRPAPRREFVPEPPRHARRARNDESTPTMATDDPEKDSR